MSDLDTALIEAQGAHVEGCCCRIVYPNGMNGPGHFDYDRNCIALRLDKQADAWKEYDPLAADTYRRLAREVRGGNGA